MSRHILSTLALAVVAIAMGACHRTEDLGHLPDAGSGGTGGQSSDQCDDLDAGSVDDFAVWNARPSALAERLSGSAVGE